MTLLSLAFDRCRLRLVCALLTLSHHVNQWSMCELEGVTVRLCARGMRACSRVPSFPPGGQPPHYRGRV